MVIQLEVETHNKVDFIDITAKIQNKINEHNTEEGICFIFCPHTTAGIVLNENWDPSVEDDVAMALKRIVPDDWSYRHREGNSPSHIQSILVSNDHFVFIHNGELKLGTWQGIFFAEFDGPRRRQVWVKLMNEVSDE
jgi:secondary thiamine-phosphate synthase enzyme